MKLFRFIPATLIILSLTSCHQQNSPQAGSSSQSVRDGVFIHISHGTDSPQRVLMALNMAVLMSDDHDVLVYFDIKGIEVVLQDSPDIRFDHFPGSKTQIQKLIDINVPLMACPGCLKAAGKTPQDLMQGMKVADKDKFFSFTGGRILTLDY